MPRLKVHAVARKRVASNLVRMMEETGTSIRALALRSGVERSGIYRIRNATSGTTVDVLGRLADAMGRDVSLFLKKRGR